MRGCLGTCVHKHVDKNGYIHTHTHTHTYSECQIQFELNGQLQSVTNWRRKSLIHPHNMRSGKLTD